MLQDLFSFQQFLIGLLRQSSSHQSIWDSVEISRVLHQITGLEFCVTPAPSASGTSTTENTARKSPDVSASTAHHTSTTTQHLQQETTIFNLRYLLIPISISDLHWTLAVVFMKDRCIRYYDSLPDRSLFHTKMRDGVLQYLKDEYKAVTDGNEINVGEWETLDCTSITPRQMNGEIIIKQ